MLNPGLPSFISIWLADTHGDDLIALETELLQD